MCGISGIINKKSGAVDSNELKRINDLISHRGPDSEGEFTYNNVGLAHRRLSILDLSLLGHQPMPYMDRYVITYNGEIYNYIELKAELISAGYLFKSGTDTEVIMAAYDCWGAECLNKFNGMWSFALLDKTKNELFFARDRFGIKPLYYKDLPDQFIFGSEIKQLLNKDKPNLVDEDILLESMLTHIDNHTSATYFKGVNSFPAGHYMIYNLSTNERSIKKYYKLNIDHKYKNQTEEQLTETFQNLLTDAIHLRLRSDVKVGTCLSGGLDSSSISAIAAKKYNEESDEKFIAINAKSIDKSNDESEFARIVAESESLDLNVVTPTYEDFLKTIDEVVFTQEEPFGSPSMFMGWHVFQKAREMGCTVMLNGQGGDEVLLGYERYFSSTLSLKRPLNFIKQVFNQSKNSRLSVFHTLAYFFYFRNSSLRIKRLKDKSFLKDEFKKNKYFESIVESAKVFNDVEEMQLLEISKLQLPHLLRYEDRNSMRHSIETRLPFLDYRLVELSLSLPLHVKIRNGWTKFILRKAVDKLLPENIVWRKNKFGFEAPEKIWLAKYRDQMLAEIGASGLLRHFCNLDQITSQYDKLSLKDKWMYFNIARWEKVYNVIIKD